MTTQQQHAEIEASSPDDGLILSPRQLGGKILEWKAKGYHVLSPAIQMTTFAPGYGVNASMVLLDPTVDKDGGGLDVYFDKTTMDGALDRAPELTDERAPSKIGLMKIAAAIGVSWVNPYGRTDPLTIQNLWIYLVTGVYLAYDGTPQTIRGEKEIDYRDGSAQIGEWTRESWADLMTRNQNLKPGQKAEWSIGGWSDKRVRQARCNGAERAETGALERAIRTLGIKHSYTIAELQRPFVALRVCPMVDMRDPDVRRQVTAGMLGGVAALYAGVQEPRRLSAVPETIDVSPRREPARQGLAEAPSAPVQARPSAPAPVVPLAAPAAAQAVPAAPLRSASPWDRDEDDLTRPAGPELRAAVAEVKAAVASAQMPHAAQPAPEGTLPDGAVLLRDVKTRQVPYGRQHEKYGQEFTKYTIVDSNGVVYVTVFGKWGQKAHAAWDAGTPVVIKSVEKSFRGEASLEIVNIVDAGQPALPLDAGGLSL